MDYKLSRNFPSIFKARASIKKYYETGYSQSLIAYFITVKQDFPSYKRTKV